MHLKKEKIVKNTRSQKGLKVSVALSESQPTPVTLVWGYLKIALD